MAKPEEMTRKSEVFAWVGSLNHICLAEVLKKIALEERSGDLQVIFGKIIKTIYFDNGFVVFAASNLKKDRLGETMVDRGRISRREFALASMLMKQSRRKFGQALVAGGLLSEEDLGQQVALQVNRILLSLFNMKAGIYSFDERPTIIPVGLMVSLSIYRILLEGIRCFPNEALIDANLPGLSTVVRVSEKPPFTINFDDLRPVEQELLRTAGKGATLESIYQGTPYERGSALRACYGLITAGLLEPCGAGIIPQPLKVQEETGAFVLSEIQSKFALIRANNVKQETLMEFDRLDWAPDADLLKVDSQANPSTIQKAYEKRNHEWDERRGQFQNEQSMVAKVDEIQIRLGRAYRQIMAGHPSAKDEVPSPGEDARADAVQPPPMPPLNEELLEEVEIELSDELLGIEKDSSADTQPVTREDSPVEKSSTSTFPRGAKPTLELTPDQKKDRIQQLLRDTKLHFIVKDWEGAVSLLHELVELTPENADHRGRLARAMARHPIMRKDAERHFIEALRLAPQSADLHFSLGLYYESFKLHSRARAEFQKTLRIQPRHEKARKHLTGGRGKKDPLSDMFRKIFG